MPRRKGTGTRAWFDPAGIENAEPTARLLAAVVKQAIADAQRGDETACRWLADDLEHWLEYIIPHDCDPEAVHAKITRLSGAERLITNAG